MKSVKNILKNKCARPSPQKPPITPTNWKKPFVWCVLGTGPSFRRSRASRWAQLSPRESPAGLGQVLQPPWAARSLAMSTGSWSGPTEGGCQWNWFSFPFSLHSTQGSQVEMSLLWSTNPAQAEQRQLPARAEIVPHGWLKGQLRSWETAHFLPYISAAQNKLKCVPSGCDELHPAVLSESYRGANTSNGPQQMLLECVKIEKAKAS